MKEKSAQSIQAVSRVIDLWLPLKIKYARTPGTSVGIVYKGKLLYKKGFGFADVATKEKADEKTLYHIASISKTFTAVSVMQLMEQGKLRLDDKVGDYLTWFKAKNKDSDAAHITIRQLLSHSAGIFRDGDTPHWDDGKFPTNLQKSFSSDSLAQESFASFKYSNYGYAVLGEVIEKVSGLSYGDYVTKHILKPLGMHNTYPDYQEGLTNIATGYGRDIPDEKQQAFPHFKANVYASATGFVSNVEDLAKYTSIFSLKEKGNPQLIHTFSKREMMHPHEDMKEGAKYGFGLDVLTIKGRKVIGHSGGFAGFITEMAYDPKNEIGVIVLSNALGSDAYQIALGILESLYTVIDDKKYAPSKKSSYAGLEGVYRNIWGDQVVAQIGAALVDFSVQANNPLKSKKLFTPKKEKNTFVAMDENLSDSVGEKVIFEDFKNGKAQKVLVGPTPLRRIK